MQISKSEEPKKVKVYSMGRTKSGVKRWCQAMMFVKRGGRGQTHCGKIDIGSDFNQKLTKKFKYFVHILLTQKYSVT